MKWMTKASITLALTLAVTSVFTTVIVQRSLSADQQDVKNPAAVIESITASGEGDSAELVIKLSSAATYTSYKTTVPLRLVVDLSQTTIGSIVSPISINKGNFKSVSVNRFDTDAGALTRVSVDLAADADAVITASPAQPGELRISFPAQPAAVTAPAIEAGATQSAVVANDSSKQVPATNAPVVTPEKNASVPAGTTPEIKDTAKMQPDQGIAPARTLKSLAVKENTIILTIDGGLGEFKTFRLSKPERFVIDLFGITNSLPSRLLPLNAVGVASARIGVYPDKIRVVLDSLNENFPEATTAKSEEGLRIILTPSAETAKAASTEMAGTEKKADKEIEPTSKAPLNAEPAPKAHETVVQRPVVEKPAPTKAGNAPAPATIESIDFQVIEDISRVAVRIKGEAKVAQPLKTPGFVTLTFKNVILPKRLQRTLDVQAFASPVLRITPLVVKTKTGVDTKVRIAMRNVAPYEFRQEGDMVIIDFKRPENTVIDKSQPVRGKTARGAKSAMTGETDIASELTPADSGAKPLETGKTYKGRKVTLEFADAEVRKIFQLLSEVSNKNFVLGDDVTGTISIKLVNVPWDQALDIILDTKGLDKREEGNIIIIKGKGKFKSQAEEEQEIKKALTKSIELKTETFSINYADTAAIATQFTALKTDRGVISVDARTNKVIVKDIPQALDDMRKLLQQLDIPEKQVMIEARIVEASTSFTRSLGINWGLHTNTNSPSSVINSLASSFGGLVSSAPTAYSNPTTNLAGAGAGSNPGGNLGISFGTIGARVQLDMRLSAAASAGLIKIVSTPKVATLNNKTAKITQGQQIPYTSSTSDKVETKFVEAALSLEVTPHINANGTIGMKIDAKNDSPGPATGGSTAPSINKKQATTEMLLRDGETTVIGGIFVDNDTESDDGVPFLMDIPLLGNLFKSNTKSKIKSELLIFITPRILNTI